MLTSILTFTGSAAGSAGGTLAALAAAFFSTWASAGDFACSAAASDAAANTATTVIDTALFNIGSSLPPVRRRQWRNLQFGNRLQRAQCNLRGRNALLGNRCDHDRLHRLERIRRGSVVRAAGCVVVEV